MLLSTLWVVGTCSQRGLEQVKHQLFHPTGEMAKGCFITSTSFVTVIALYVLLPARSIYLHQHPLGLSHISDLSETNNLFLSSIHTAEQSYCLQIGIFSNETKPEDAHPE